MSKPVLIDTAPQLNRIATIKNYEGKQFPLPFHMHEKYEITLIVNGAGTRIIGDNIDTFNAGDVVILAPMLPHQWKSSPLDSTRNVKATTIFLDEHFPTADFQKLQEYQEVHRFLTLAKRGIQLTGNLKKYIAEKITKLDGVENMELILSIFTMLNEIIHSEEYFPISNEHYIINQNFDTGRISIITEYINQNLYKNIGIAELASLVCLHPNSLSRIFKQSTGYSIIEYVNRIRIAMACKLLDETNETIVNIGFKCGFQNPSYFNRIFKKIKKTTPSKYRFGSNRI